MQVSVPPQSRDRRCIRSREADGASAVARQARGCAQVIMADSKLAEAKNGSRIAGAAYKVKYRKEFGGGHGAKVRLRPFELRVHRQNRGGVYPTGIRLQDLTVDIGGNGLVQEEWITTASSWKRCQ